MQYTSLAAILCPLFPFSSIPFSRYSSFPLSLLFLSRIPYPLIPYQQPLEMLCYEHMNTNGMHLYVYRFQPQVRALGC